MVSRLYNKLKTSPKLEQEGVELNIGDMLKVQVARAGGANQKYNAAATKLAREHRRAIDNDLLSDAKGKQIMFELFAETVVLNVWSNTAGEDAEPVWVEGIEQPDGSIAEPSFENVIQLFKTLEEVFVQVKETADDLTFYRASLIEGIVKN